VHGLEGIGFSIEEIHENLQTFICNFVTAVQQVRKLIFEKSLLGKCEIERA